MKLKLLLLIFGVSLVLFGCKKGHIEEDPLTSARKQIIGTWIEQSGIITYYDSTGKVVDTQTTFVGTNNFVLDADTLKTPDSNTSYFKYTLTTVAGKIMMDVANESFEVSFDNNTMTWLQRRQYQNEAYTNSVYTLKFKKQ